jgi:hypothetical protein
MSIGLPNMSFGTWPEQTGGSSVMLASVGGPRSADINGVRD